jgi:hypothetical protein
MIYRAPKKTVDISLDSQINEGLKKMGLQSFSEFHLEIRHNAEPITAAKKIVGTGLHFGTSSEDNFRIGSMMIVGAILVIVACVVVHVWDRDDEQDEPYERVTRRIPDSSSGSSTAVGGSSESIRRRGGGRARSKSSPRNSGKKQAGLTATVSNVDAASATATSALNSLVGGVSSVVEGVSNVVATGGGAGGKKLKDGKRLKIQPEGQGIQNPIDAGQSKKSVAPSLLPI